MMEEGRIYHVYNRVGGEEMPFEDHDLASRFVELLRKVVERDEMVVYAWVLMGNHFHQVVRMGAAPLSRSMKTLQQEVTRARNLKAKIYGPLWQGRFKAKRVVDEGYLSQLIAYVHLNPVKAGLVDEIGRYRWSGHRDVLGLRRRPIVSVDDVLTVYGESRRVALRRYRSALREVGNQSGRIRTLAIFPGGGWGVRRRVMICTRLVGNWPTSLAGPPVRSDHDMRLMIG
jgi:REP element-mobilizing transposase RayT